VNKVAIQYNLWHTDRSRGPWGGGGTKYTQTGKCHKTMNLDNNGLG
jgi:hypothetical protein